MRSNTDTGRKRNYNDILYLGANLPTERLDSTLSETRPHLVALAGQQLPTAATLLEAAKLAHEAGVTVVYV